MSFQPEKSVSPKPDTREEVISIFNRAYKNLAKDAEKWSKQESPAPVERRLLLGFQTTEAGIKRITGEKPQPENALSPDLKTDYFKFIFNDPYSKDERTHDSYEGIAAEIARTCLAYEVWVLLQAIKIAQNPDTIPALKGEIALLKHQRAVIRRNSKPLFETLMGNDARKDARIAWDAHARSENDLTKDETQDKNWINAERALRRRLILRLPAKRAEILEPIPNQKNPGCWLGTAIALVSIPAEIYSSISEGAKDIVFGSYDVTRDTSDILIESGKHSVKKGKEALSAIRTKASSYIKEKTASITKDEPTTWGIVTIPDNKVAPTKERSIKPLTENPEKEKGRRRLDCLPKTLAWLAVIAFLASLQSCNERPIGENSTAGLGKNIPDQSAFKVTDISELGLESAVIATRIDPFLVEKLGKEKEAKELRRLQKAISAKERTSDTNIPADDPDFNAAVGLTEEILKDKLIKIHEAYMAELKRVNADHPNLFNLPEVKHYDRFGNLPITDALLGYGFKESNINKVMSEVLISEMK